MSNGASYNMGTSHHRVHFPENEHIIMFHLKYSRQTQSTERQKAAQDPQMAHKP